MDGFPKYLGSSLFVGRIIMIIENLALVFQLTPIQNADIITSDAKSEEALALVRLRYFLSFNSLMFS